MTKTIKIRCDIAQKTIAGIVWIAIGSLLLYSAFLHYETANSYDSKNDCHFNYIDNRQVCQSTYEKTHNANDQPSDKSYFVNTMYAAIVLFMIEQVMGFLLLNWIKGWVKIECISKENKN